MKAPLWPIVSMDGKYAYVTSGGESKLHKINLTTMQDESKCGALLGVHPCFPSPTQLRTFPGTYSVLRGAGQQSTIYLPLLPYGFFKPTGGKGAEPAAFG